MMPSSSGASRKSSGVGDRNVADQFPAGLRVLSVDDDSVCLTIFGRMLTKCNYEVTKCSRAEVALSLLRENKNGYDVVISDVHMPDMDGFKLLVHIGLEMDLPVIMMSADDSKSVVMKGVTHGACDYLIKPVRIEALRNIWQHVIRKKKNEWKDIEPSAGLDDVNRQQKSPEEDPDSSSANEVENGKISKRRKEDEGETDERDDSSSLKKPRFVWSQELHQQFVAAVRQLGIEKAVPKKILDVMNVPGLTRENVVSHLQKFRLYLRRLSGSQQSGGINTSFMDNPNVGYGSISSLGELDLQALAASGQLGQLPAQSSATLQAVTLGRSSNSNSPVSVPLADQRQPVVGDNQAVSHTSSIVDFSANHRTESTGNSSTAKGSLGILTNSREGFVPSYSIANNVNHIKSHDWGSQGMDSTFHPSQHTNNMQGGLNVLQRNCTSSQTTGGGKGMFLTGENSGTQVADNSSWSRAGNINYGEGSGTHVDRNPSWIRDGSVDNGKSSHPFCPEEYGLDDLTARFTQSSQLNNPSSSSATCQSFLLSDIAKATNDFSNYLGKGAFGKVYSGNIISGNSYNGVVAVKRMSKEAKEGILAFEKEIELVSACNHVNIISLVGFCNELDEKILIYELMPNGSLYDYLYKHKDHIARLTIKQRLEICIGVAKGLDYLHSRTDFVIIHSDLKTDNILLDQNLVPKISDFGLSRTRVASPSTSKQITNHVKGTTGYIAPECYEANYKLSRKADVYAYGIVLLEVLCERRAWDNLVILALPFIWMGQLPNFTPDYVTTYISTRCSLACAHLIMECLDTNPVKRPDMNLVVTKLEEALKLQQK